LSASSTAETRRRIISDSAEDWRSVLEPIVARYPDLDIRRFFRGDPACVVKIEKDGRVRGAWEYQGHPGRCGRPGHAPQGHNRQILASGLEHNRQFDADAELDLDERLRLGTRLTARPGRTRPPVSRGTLSCLKKASRFLLTFLRPGTSLHAWPTWPECLRWESMAWL
jgi:hypothetical protein